MMVFNPQTIALNVPSDLLCNGVNICFGSQSQIGEHFTERLLTVVRTCQLHDINAFEFLTKLVNTAFSANLHPPSLPASLQN
jgi:hypothetical protein